MPSSQRTVTHFFYGLSIPEIAAALDADIKIQLPDEVLDPKKFPEEALAHKRLRQQLGLEPDQSIIKVKAALEKLLQIFKTKPANVDAEAMINTLLQVWFKQNEIYADTGIVSSRYGDLVNPDGMDLETPYLAIEWEIDYSDPRRPPTPHFELGATSPVSEDSWVDVIGDLINQYAKEGHQLSARLYEPIFKCTRI